MLVGWHNRSKKDPMTVARETGRALSTVYLIKADKYIFHGAPLGRPKAHHFQKEVGFFGTRLFEE